MEYPSAVLAPEYQSKDWLTSNGISLSKEAVAAVIKALVNGDDLSPRYVAMIYEAVKLRGAR
jgi:hypothetical protein